MAANAQPQRVVDSSKVWTTLITNTAYLPGLLTLEASLRYASSKYPLIALYTDTFPAEGHEALDKRGIAKKHVPYLLPKTSKDFSNDPRFYDCWSKLTPFSLTEYERVVQLDSDMLVLKNMDELMDLPLDSADKGGKGERVFAASHACVCNPLHKPHYPKTWIPANCAFTSQHSTPDQAQTEGAPPTAGLAMPNGGLQVVVPSMGTYNLILSSLEGDKIDSFDFADQSVHDAIWRDDQVKNMHYLLSPKPWDEDEGFKKVPWDSEERKGRDPANEWWWDVSRRRWGEEKGRGIEDGF
ncbi:hypothetical protein LTR97_009060 [Elasticomyces elasticus]|uniref:Glycosyltransferase family 8 protein n=1 Tax=Elasticomyces elasticus TaxID=574655 RepID=A0AAN7WCA7_9PEZI|nr:hypothetical protein LTR97_009060 [Elasticomyces elasticus]